jgi:hypothetical protein
MEQLSILVLGKDAVTFYVDRICPVGFYGFL